MPTPSLTSRFLSWRFLYRPLLILALCMGVLFFSCDSSNVTEPPLDDGNPGPDPAGVLLDGNPADPALDAIVMMLPTPVARADVADHLLLTRLTAYINPAATVGQVNEALTTSDVRIIAMWTGLPAMILKVPRLSDRAEADALAATIQATDAFHVVLPTHEAYIDPDGGEVAPQPFQIAPAGEDVPEHVRLQQFIASWHGIEAARQVNNKVTVYVPDFYFNRVPHPLIPSQVFVGDGGELNWSIRGFYPGNHGFHIAGTIGATNTSGVAGVHSDSDLTEIRSLPLYTYGFLGTMYRIAEQFPSGRFVLNTSLGSNDPFFDKTTKLERARLAAIWRSLTFEISDQFFHAAAGGNDGWEDEEGGESRYSSPFNVSEHYSDLRTLAAEDDTATQEDQDNFTALLALLNGAEFHPDNILTVGNSKKDGQKSGGSSRGANVRAIGVDVKATCVKESDLCDGTAATLSGSSMASPQVAGLAAYVMNLDPTLTPTQVRDLIQYGYDNAQTGMLPAFAVALATDKSLGSAPFRKAMLDVTNAAMQEGMPDGVFDEHDLELYLSKLSSHTGDDYSRYDLNGNGRTRTADAGRFDLDVNDPPTWSVVNQTIAGEPVTFDENEVSDLDILCYYAFSPLYQGDTDARLELLRDACTDGGPEIIIISRYSRSDADAYISTCPNARVKSETNDYEPFVANLENSSSCAEGEAEASVQYSDSLSFSRSGSLTGIFVSGSASASATQLEAGRFNYAQSGGNGQTGHVWFEVVGRPANFQLDLTATAETSGPSDAHAHIQIHILKGNATHYLRFSQVDGDSIADPIVWQEHFELQPGIYGVKMVFNVGCRASDPDTNILQTATSSWNCSFTLDQ